MRPTAAILLVSALLAFAFPSPAEPQEKPAAGAQEPAPGAAPVQEPERENLQNLVEGCRKCHEDVYGEWEKTQHAKSWSDPVFQAEIAALPDKGESCARCHAPQELLNQGYGKIPAARKLARDLGVNCVTCHMKGNTYHGPFESTGHGGVDASPEFRQAGMCLSCHGQPEARKEHDQGTTFLAGPAPGEGKTCQTCHMPEVQRKLVTNPQIKEKYLIGVQPCRVHSFTGARRNEIVKGAAEASARFDGGELVVEIVARTGHALPASSNREVSLTVVLSDAQGAEAGRDTRSWRFPDGPILQAGKTETVRVAAAPSVSKAQVTLVQKLTGPEIAADAAVQPIAEVAASR